MDSLNEAFAFENAVHRNAGGHEVFNQLWGAARTAALHEHGFDRVVPSAFTQQYQDHNAQNPPEWPCSQLDQWPCSQLETDPQHTAVHLLDLQSLLQHVTPLATTTQQAVETPNDPQLVHNNGCFADIICARQKLIR